MSKYTDEFVKMLCEGVMSIDGEEEIETFPYVEKLSEYLGLEDAADLYAFFTRAFDYESVENVEMHKDSMDDWEYEISKMFFDKFGKMDTDFDEEDFKKFGSNREEYDAFHNSLIS